MFPDMVSGLTHATPQWRRHAFRALVDNQPAEHVPIGPVSNRRSRPHSSPVCCTYCSPYSSVRVEGLAGGRGLHDRCCQLCQLLAEILDSALHSGKESPLPWILHAMYKVHGTKICRARARVPYGPQPTQARGGFRRLTRNRSRAVASQRRIALGRQASCPPSPLPVCQSILAACFRGGTTTMERRLEKHYGS